MLCGPGLGYAGWCWLHREQTRATTPEQEYHQALARWEERAAGHENAELARLAGQPEWGTVLIPGHRTDIFGGTLAGWQALLTVHGASILAERPLLTVDLTGQHAAGMLSAAARDAGIPSVTYRLPHELGRCGLLNDLTPGQLADAIAESLHAGTPDGARADRAVDVWILQQLTGALGGGGRPARNGWPPPSAPRSATPPQTDCSARANRNSSPGDLFPAGVPAAGHRQPGPTGRGPRGTGRLHRRRLAAEARPVHLPGHRHGRAQRGRRGTHRPDHAVAHRPGIRRDRGRARRDHRRSRRDQPRTRRAPLLRVRAARRQQYGTEPVQGT